MPSVFRVVSRYLCKQGQGSSSFDLSLFDSFPVGSSAREEYLATHAGFLTRGESREVYDIGNGTVLKVLRPTAQVVDSNLTEAEISQCLPGSRVLCPVFEHSPDGSWLTMAKAETPLSSSAFLGLVNKELGFPQDLSFRPPLGDTAFYILMKTVLGIEPRPYYRNETEARWKWLEDYSSPWWEDFKRALLRCRLGTEDLNHRNWGVYRNHLVVLDYGT